MFQFLPTVFRKLHEQAAEGKGPEALEAAKAAGNVESSVALGFTSAIAALGLFFIPALFATSIHATGTPQFAISVFSVFYLSCMFTTWWYYRRKDAETRCD